VTERNIPTDLDLIRTRNLKWHRLVWPGGDQALVSDYNQLGADRRALLDKIERLERELALSKELEQAMADCIGVEDGQTFEQRAEELIVMEVAYQNAHGATAVLSERPADDVPAPPPPPAPPPMRYIKEGVHLAGCEHGVKIGTHCTTCDAMESKHSTRTTAHEG
jgi:hypothetical protein